MARCDYCGSTILLGGARSGDLRFCNAKCQQNGQMLVASRQIPQDVVEKHLWEIHQGACPVCQGRGPIDVHTSHKVWSALLLTSWSSQPQVSCRSCGVKSQLQNLLFSLVLGWWGFPWGLVMTPVQVIRNVIGMSSSPDPLKPSEKLERLVRLNLAASVARQGV